MYGKEDSEDLRNEIYQLKKQFLNATTENNLLKVKIRKLLDEINRKDKQLDAIFDPKKSPDIRKIIYEKNASFIMNIKEKNDKLKKIINEKDAMIKRLQKQLEVVKLYSNGSTQFLNCKFNDNLECEENAKKRSNLKVSYGKKQENEELKRTRSLSWTPESISKSNNIEDENSKKTKRPASYDVKDQYRGLSREHLLSIIENLKNNQSQCGSSSRKSSPESDLDCIDLFCNSPHEEIQQLHHHFLEMITEVDYLKTTISQLQDDQQKTEHVLRKKDNSIDKLAAEIKSMKKPKSRKKRGNNRFSYEDTVTFYSNSFSRECNRNFEKSKILNANSGKSNNLRTRKAKSTKDVMTQIEESNDSDNPASFRSYIDKGSVVITKKPQATQTVGDLNSNSNDDDEQILEEYDDDDDDDEQKD